MSQKLLTIPYSVSNKTVFWIGSVWEQVQATLAFIDRTLPKNQGSILIILPRSWHPFREIFWDAIHQRGGSSQVVSKEKFETQFIDQVSGSTKVVEVREGNLGRFSISDLVGDKGDRGAQVRLCGFTKGINILYQEIRSIRGVVIVGTDEMVTNWRNLGQLHSLLGRIIFLNNPPNTLVTVSGYKGGFLANWLKKSFGFQVIDEDKSGEYKWTGTAEGALAWKKRQKHIWIWKKEIVKQILFVEEDYNRLKVSNKKRSEIIREINDQKRMYEKRWEEIEDDFEGEKEEAITFYGGGEVDLEVPKKARQKLEERLEKLKEERDSKILDLDREFEDTKEEMARIFADLPLTLTEDELNQKKSIEEEFEKKGKDDLTKTNSEEEEGVEISWEEFVDMVLSLCRVTRTKEDLLEYLGKHYLMQKTLNQVSDSKTLKTSLKESTLESIKVLREWGFLNKSRMRSTTAGKHFSKLGTSFRDCKNLLEGLRELLEAGEDFDIVWTRLREGAEKLSKGLLDDEVFEVMVKAVMQGREPTKLNLEDPGVRLRDQGAGYTIEVAIVVTDLLTSLVRDMDDSKKEKKYNLATRWLQGISKAVRGKFDESDREKEYQRPLGRRKGQQVGNNDAALIRALDSWTLRASTRKVKGKFLGSFTHYKKLAWKARVPERSALDVVKRIFRKEDSKFEKWLRTLDPHLQETVGILRQVAELRPMRLKGSTKSLVIVLHRQKTIEKVEEEFQRELQEEPGTSQRPDTYSTRMTCGNCDYFEEQEQGCVLFYRIGTKYPSDIPRGLEERAFWVAKGLMACPWVTPKGEQPRVHILRGEEEGFELFSEGFDCPRCHHEFEEEPRPGVHKTCERCGTRLELISWGKYEGYYRLWIGVEDQLQRDFKYITTMELPKITPKLRGPILKGLERCKVIWVSSWENIEVTPHGNDFELSIISQKGTRTEIITKEDAIDVSDNESFVRKLLEHSIRVNHRTIALLINHEDKAKFERDKEGEPILFLWKRKPEKKKKRKKKTGLRKRNMRRKKEEKWRKYRYYTNELSYVRLINRPTLARQLRKVGVEVSYSPHRKIPKKASKELRKGISSKGVREELIWAHSIALSLSVYFALLSLPELVPESMSLEQARVEIQEHLRKTTQYLMSPDFSRMKRNSLEGRAFKPFVRTIRGTVFNVAGKEVPPGRLRMIEMGMGRTRARRIDAVRETAFEMAAARTPYDSALNWFNQRLRSRLRRINAVIGYGYNTVPLFSHTSRDHPAIAGHLDLEEVGRIITRLELLKLVTKKRLHAGQFDERLNRLGFPYFVPKLIAASTVSRALKESVFQRKIRYKGRNMRFIEAHRKHAQVLYDCIVSKEFGMQEREGDNIEEIPSRLDEEYTPLVFAPEELLDKDQGLVKEILEETKSTWLKATFPRTGMYSLSEEDEKPEAPQESQGDTHDLIKGVFKRIEESLALT